MLTLMIFLSFYVHFSGLLVHGAFPTGYSLKSWLRDKLKSQLVPVERLILAETIQKSPSHSSLSTSCKELQDSAVELHEDDFITSAGQGMPEPGRNGEEFVLVKGHGIDYRDRQGYYFVGDLDQETPFDECTKEPKHILLFDFAIEDTRDDHQLSVSAGGSIDLLPSCHDDTAQGQVWHLARNNSGQVGYVPIEYIYPSVQRNDKSLSPSPSPVPKIEGFKLPFSVTPELPSGSTKGRSYYYWHSPPSRLPPKVYQVRYKEEGTRWIHSCDQFYWSPVCSYRGGCSARRNG